jgi:hypothetical protein
MSVRNVPTITLPAEAACAGCHNRIARTDTGLAKKVGSSYYHQACYRNRTTSRAVPPAAQSPSLFSKAVGFVRQHPVATAVALGAVAVAAYAFFNGTIVVSECCAQATSTTGEVFKYCAKYVNGQKITEIYRYTVEQGRSILDTGAQTLSEEELKKHFPNGLQKCFDMAVALKDYYFR